MLSIGVFFFSSSFHYRILLLYCTVIFDRNKCLLGFRHQLNSCYSDVTARFFSQHNLRKCLLRTIFPSVNSINLDYELSGWKALMTSCSLSFFQQLMQSINRRKNPEMIILNWIQCIFISISHTKNSHFFGFIYFQIVFLHLYESSLEKRFILN